VVKALELMPGDSMLEVRNRALLLTGYAGALRRSELIGLDWEDVEVAEEGATLTIRKSKTDQTGQGTAIGIPRGTRAETCPVEALERWRKLSGVETGPIFQVVGRAGKINGERLSSKAVSRLVKELAQRLGFDPSQFSAHSLRAGLATSAAQNGASERKIMDQTRHRSVKTLRIYIRDGELFRDNAVKQSGL
jgi:integrase